MFQATASESYTMTIRKILRDIHDLQLHDFLHTKITPHNVNADEGNAVD